MKKKALAKFISGAVLLPLGLLAFSGVASASAIQVEGSVFWDGKTTNTLSTSAGSVQAGEPKLVVDTVSGDLANLPTGLSGATDLTDLEFSSYVWCIDPLQPAGSGWDITWDLVALEDAPDPGDPMGVRADDLRLLFGNVYSTVLGGTVPITGVADGEVGSIEFDAFQLAIWEISQETLGTYSLDESDGGYFWATAPSDAVELANDWLDNLNNDV